MYNRDVKAIASLTKVKEIQARFGLKAQKKYGQNFLIDANIVRKIAALACDKEHLTIEIGPGIGSLTEMLSKESKKVIAYEIDNRLIPILKDNLSLYDNIEIINEDFLNLDLNKCSFFDEELNIASNLPYYITTPILFKLFESDLKILKITVMVQKEVAERFKAEVNSEDYNALSIIVQYLYDVNILMNISRNVFDPKPNVDSAIIAFYPKFKNAERDRTFEKAFFRFIKDAFKQRRKTLYNNLKALYPIDRLEMIYEKCNLDRNIRPQQINLETFLKIYEVLNER